MPIRHHFNLNLMDLENEPNKCGQVENEAWDPDKDGVEELLTGLLLDDDQRMRLVGMRLALSGFSFEAARAWLADTVPGAIPQHRVSRAWHFLTFPCGTSWWH